MSDQTWFVAAMVIYLIVMLLIGLNAFRQSDNYEGFMLGGRKLHPFTAALSAGASDMSGWLLMGLPGTIYVLGYSELWIVIGLVIGATANWYYTAPRLRAYTEVADNSITVPSFLENRFEDKTRILRVAAGVFILIFFTFYVASGMVAGGRYFESTFNGNYLTGMIIVGGVTVAYTFVGGFIAVSRTDVVQGLIMFTALVLVPIIAIISLGDTNSIFSWQTESTYGLGAIEPNPNWFSLFTGVSAIAVISNLAWGLGYFGQPHIIVRFMALRSPGAARAGMAYGIIWMILCLIGATFVATIAPAFFERTPGASIADTVNFETIFLDMGRILFHPLIAGLVLTAVLAAIMSTISSQLLVVASALIEDLYKGMFKKDAPDAQLKNLSRVSVLIVALFALLIALNPESAVLSLVSFAWAGFGSAFGPVIIASLYWRRLNAAGAAAGLITGGVVAFIWGGLPAFGVMDKPFGLYEMVPGVLLGTLAMIIVTLLTKAPSEKIQRTFDAAAELAKTKDVADRNSSEQPAVA